MFMKDTTKRYLKSTGVTFLASFCIAIAPDLDNLTLESFTNGFAIGLLFSGVRGGFKGLVELVIYKYGK